MRLVHLVLNEFRNFKHSQVELRPRLNFFVGDNGQGKTNLLEAVYLLCRGTSFRPSDSTTLLRRGGPGRAKIGGYFIHRDLSYKVEFGIEPGRKVAKINEKSTNSAGLMARLPVVLFSPESLSAIKDGPEQRRELIDEVLINHDPRQARILREFSKALRSRNRLLKNIAEGIGSRGAHEASLESLNKIYFLLATHLTTARLKALKDLEPEFRNAMRSILEEPDADIAVDYVISGESALHWSEAEVFDALQKRHRELAAQELASGHSLVGPHKHDIKLLFHGNDSRFYCSQGQQRALILALKIAQIVYHHRVHELYPILLLDDVTSELDAKKRVSLMKFLEGISAQILITSTDLTWADHFEHEKNSVFWVADGVIEMKTS